MRSESFSLAYVDGMIDYLERKIESNDVTASLLETMQKWLDTVEDMYCETQTYAAYYSRLLELQTLIYGENQNEEKAMEFLKEAVRQAGGVPKLYSQLLRDYIAQQTRRRQEAVLQPAPEPVIPVHPEPADEQPYVQPEAVSVESDSVDMQPVPDIADMYERREARHAAEYHNLPKKKHRTLKVAFASVFALAVVGAAVAHFVPQTAAVSSLVLKHDEITRAKDHYDSLTAQYATCSAKLSSERDSIDTADDQAVNNYNQEMKNCQSILDQQHNAADIYNNLIGKS